MSENLNEILVRKILNSIPKNKKAINYLMDILNIGQESTYRRMRGDIPFTFEEIVKLSSLLNFSIDEIIGRNVRINDYFSDSEQKDLPASDKHFFLTHLDYYNILESTSTAKEIEIMYSLNRLISFFVVDFEKLFKFNYFMWVNQSNNVSLNTPFSEIEIPSYIASIQENIKSKLALGKNVVFIGSQYFILRLIRDVQYYYHRNLISDTELHEIKDEMMCFLDKIEKYIQTGSNGNGSAYQFYLSLINVDMNSVYCSFDDSVISRYWSYLNIAVNRESNDIIAIHKSWIYSLKRSSILISRSNEIAQSEFFNQQRKFVETITNDLFFYYG